MVDNLKYEYTCPRCGCEFESSSKWSVWIYTWECSNKHGIGVYRSKKGFKPCEGRYEISEWLDKTEAPW